MFPAFSLIPGPLSPVYRWYLSGLIQLPMNIGMCLHPIDPAIRGGDHRVSQTQTEHDISPSPARPAHTGKHTCTSTFAPKKKKERELKSDFKINPSRKLKRQREMKTKIPVYIRKHTQTNPTHRHAHACFNLAMGQVVGPILPPGLPCLFPFVEKHRCLRNNSSPTTDSGSDIPGPSP